MAERSRIIFNSDIIKYMSMFNSVTRTDLKDCIDTGSRLVFIVAEGMAGKAIGKQGANVKMLGQSLKREIKIVEMSADLAQFVKNLVYPSKVRDITVEGSICTIYPMDMHSRSMMIGRNAVTLRENESIARRYFDIVEIKVK